MMEAYPVRRLPQSITRDIVHSKQCLKICPMELVLIFLVQQEPVTPRDSAIMWTAVAKDYMLKENYQKAIENTRRALKHDSTYTTAYLIMAKAFLHLDMPDSAISIYEVMVKKFPDKPEGYQGLGYVYGVVKKEYDKAIEYYRKALELDPTNEAILFGLAKVYEEAGKPGEARTLYEALIKKYPDQLKFYIAYAKFLYEIKDYKAASDIIEKAYSMDSTNVDIWKLGYKINGDYYKQLKKENPESPDVVKYAKRTIKYLEKLYEKEPDNFKYAYDLADAYVVAGMGKKAISLLKKLAEKKNHSSIYIKLGYVYSEHLKDLANAEKMYKKALELAKQEGSAKNISFIYVNLGDIYYDRATALRKKKQYCKAYKVYDTAIAFYNKALSEGKIPSESLRKYVLKKKDVTKKYRQIAWRKCNNID